VVAHFRLEKLALIATLAIVAMGVATPSACSQEIGTELIEAFTEPYRVLDLAAAEPGILQRFAVKQGDRIAAGDLVASLNTEVLRARLDLARVRANLKGAIKKAQADVAQKRRRYGKLAGLHQNGHASPEEIDTARSNLEIAEAGLLEAQESQKLAQLEQKQIEAQLSRREIRSPFDGQVVKLEKDEGEYVASLEPIVAQVVQLDKLRVKFFIDTARARSLQRGDQLNVLLLDGNQQVETTVEFVSPVTDADSRTVRVEVVIDNAEQRYRSGVPVRFASYREARMLNGRIRTRATPLPYLQNSQPNKTHLNRP